MFPSQLLSVKIFNTYCNTSCHILFCQFDRLKLIRFNDFNQLNTDIYFSIKELEVPHLQFFSELSRFQWYKLKQLVQISEQQSQNLKGDQQPQI